MKIFFNLLRSNRKAQGFFMFTIFFFAGMWCSKTVHPLWFEYNNTLSYFGISYTVMAIAGSLSVFTGMLVDKFGTAWTLRIGTICYSVALVLRVFADSLVLSVISGLIGGIGASTVLVSLRPWILSWSTEEERPAAVSLNQTGSNLGISVGVIIAGFGTLALGSLTSSYPVILLFSSLLVLMGVFFVPKIKQSKTSKDKKEEKIRYSELIKEKKMLATGVIFFGILAGLVVSMLNPYLPLILKDLGLSLPLISVVTVILTVLRIIVHPFLSGRINDRNKQRYFALSEILVAVCLLILLIPLSPILVMLVVILRSIFLSASVLSEELMQMSMFSEKLVGVLFGLAQTSFFIGDSLGGTIAGWLYNNTNVYVVLIITAVLTVINAVLYPIFYKAVRHQKETQKGETHAVPL